MVVIEICRHDLSSPTAQALIAALNDELRSRYSEHGVGYFRLDPEEVRPGRGAFLVAYLGGIPVGCGAVRMLDDGTAEIKRMYVAPAFRQRGVARRVLETLEREARELGLTRLMLETGTRQPEAIALYESAGYVARGPFGEYDASPLNMFFEKRL